MEKKDLNRIKIVLAEKKRSNKWLSETISKNEGTVSRWCRNVQQPDLETLNEIAEVLKVDVCDLLVRNKPKEKE